MDDRFASECKISSSQEETLRRIPGWELELYAHRISSTQRANNLSEDEDEEEEEEESHGLSPALGAKRTIICSAPDSEDFSDQYHTQALALGDSQPTEEEFDVRNVSADDSFDCKFESDRDQSPVTQSQSIRIEPNDLYNSEAVTPQQTQAFSGSVKRVSGRLRHHNQITPKPTSCRRLVMGPSNDDGQCKSAAIPPAKSSPILAADEQSPITQPFSQEGLLGDIGGSDMQPRAARLANPHEGQVGFKDGAQGWVFQRILPSSFKAASLQKTSTDRLEEDPGNQKEYGPKRQRLNPKPFPETLMDVIMHYSGEPPSRSEDVDIVEVAINAGMTFPPPLSRNRFRG